MARPRGIQEPVPRLLQQVLRRVVLDHATGENRRRFPPMLHVGVPGSEVRRFEVRGEDRLDLALRIEIVEAMCRPSVARGAVPLLWLTRTPDDSDQDTDWVAAVGCAGPELGLDLDLVVVTRRSWHDPRSGTGRAWRRLRPPRPPAGATPEPHQV